MLLTRIRRLLSRRNDEGAVLVSVIGVSAVVLVVVSLVASSAVTAASFSSVTRASLQSRAAADAGIDTVWAEWQSGHFYCALEQTQSSGLHFSAEMEYYAEDGSLITCTGTQTLLDDPVRGLIISTGYAESPGVNETGDERTILGLFNIEITEHKATLDKALFTEGGIGITNGLNILDGAGLNSANIYSNGDITCHTNNYVQGNAYVQGNFTVSNNCLFAGSIWAGGSVNASTQLIVNGDIMSAGLNATPASGVDLAQTWVGGSVVANGNVTSSNNTNKAYCSIAGYQAKVCGSIVSIEGTVTLSNGSNVAGNIYSKGDVNLGSTNANLIVGGNVISNNGGLLASNSNGSGLRVGGFVALKNASAVAKANIGNKVGSCATSTTGLVPCVPASPEIPLSNLPAQLNFPSNVRVVAPPRESMPRVLSDATSLNGWTGWTSEEVDCANLDTRLAAGWTGKLLLKITGCTTPISWNNNTITLTGDLALINPAGWDNSNTQQIVPNSSVRRTFMMIVPSDAKMPDGTTDLVTWTNPIPTDLAYFKPTCVAGNYGDIRADKMFTTGIDTFIYTACDFWFSNQMKDFSGQIYSGTAHYPNTATMTFKTINVPGAVTAEGSQGISIVITPTSRFDARD